MIQLPKTLLLLDAHPLFVDGLALALRAAWPGAQLLRATEAGEAVKMLSAGGADAVLAGWDVLHGSELQSLLRAAQAAPVLILADRPHDQSVRTAIQAGARGFLLKTMPGDAICSAVVVALNGGSCFPTQALANHAQPQAAPARRRGQRELEVLAFLNDGLSNKAIARELGLSVATVKLHVQSILRSTGARSRIEAVSRAKRMGILPPSA